jgi:hypothetical protein
MPLVKVISSKNPKSSKLIKTDDLDELKEKAEAKLGYKIETFKREEDDCEIDDNDAFLALCESGKEFSLIAVQNGSDDEGSPKSSKQKIKVFSIGEKEPAEILAENLETLKSKTEVKFGIEVDKFVRKLDGSEIDDDEVLVELMSIEKNLELVALEDGDIYGINFFKEPFLII